MGLMQIRTAGTGARRYRSGGGGPNSALAESIVLGALDGDTPRGSISPRRSGSLYTPDQRPRISDAGFTLKSGAVGVSRHRIYMCGETLQKEPREKQEKHKSSAGRVVE